MIRRLFLVTFRLHVQIDILVYFFDCSYFIIKLFFNGSIGKLSGV